uniref:Guanylate binding protein 3 n=1 Tax=Stichopus japonicus TaxID=307972 RepID=A0AB39J761_STIJA
MAVDKAVPLCLPDNQTWDAEEQCIHINEGAPRNKLQLCEEGLNIIKSIDHSTVVVCITGPVRSGKSFLLSQIQNGGRFDVHHGTTSKTTGIWIASPECTVMRNGHPARLIFLDTEGLGSLNTSDGNEDNTWERKLLALSLLLSSYFIFNSQGTPSYDDLLKLGFLASFSEFVKKAKMPQRRGRHTTHQSNTSLPDFLWLIRDAILQPELKNKPCTWSNYIKETILQNRNASSPDQRNQIRKSMIDTFGEIDAESLPFPSIDRVVIQTLDSPEGISNLNPTFNDALQHITTKINESANVKKEVGKVLKGRDLADLLQAYVNVLNTPNGIIDVESAWDCLTAAKEAERLYANEMRAIQMPCEEEQVDACHLIATDKTLTLISSKTGKCSASDIEFYTAKFNAQIKEKLRSCHVKNEELPRSMCKKIKKKMKTKYLQQTNVADLKDVKKARQGALQEYQKSARGPAKMVMLNELESLVSEFEERAGNILSEKFFDQAVSLYRDEIRKLKLPCSNRQLNKLHRSACSKAESFYTNMIGNDGNRLISDRRSQLLTEIENEKSIIADNNSRLSQESCDDLMRSLRNEHLKPIIDNLGTGSNIQDLKDGFERVLNHYDRGAVGPRSQYVRKTAVEDVETLIKESQRTLIQRGMHKAKEFYTQQLYNLPLPCSEEYLYRTDRTCLGPAKERFKFYCTGCPSEVCEKSLQTLTWELKGIFDTRKFEIHAISKEDLRKQIERLERDYRLDDTLQNSSQRNEDNVKIIHSQILREFKQSARGVGVDEFYEETKSRYQQTQAQRRKEDKVRNDLLWAGGALAFSMLAYGVSKFFETSDDDKERKTSRRSSPRKY